ncbi:MAG: hypothetical protein LH609_08605, partial [Rudanella sp.]|nr:hypothetical protein [Rudanella sp.]
STVSLPELKERSIAVLRASMSDIRSLIHDMHPRSLTDQGLSLTIADMVGLLNKSKQICLVFESKPLPENLSEVVEINLFRVVQELLQNALKHAQATHIWLHLYAEDTTLYLTYRDNGRGLAPALPDKPAGNGLLNIRQRIMLLKGTCSFESVSGQGITVSIAVPIE